jgi:hypothetical protein
MVEVKLLVNKVVVPQRVVTRKVLNIGFRLIIGELAKLLASFFFSFQSL